MQGYESGHISGTMIGYVCSDQMKVHICCPNLDHLCGHSCDHARFLNMWSCVWSCDMLYVCLHVYIGLSFC